MKRLRSVNQLTSVGGTVGTSGNSKVTLELTSANHCMTVNRETGETQHTIEASYIYTNENGDILPTINGNVIRIPNKAIIIGMHSMIPPVISTDNCDRFEKEYLASAKLQMMQTYGLSSADIEEIDY